jgi:dolichol-phosphate mannosyltransferase
MSTETPVSSPATSDSAAPATRGVSIIVPTYKEVLNIPHLVERIEPLRAEHNLDIELLLMDDDSRDGSEEQVAKLGKDWVRLIVRKENRGLSPAVVDGLVAARHDVLVVMDADLSHPPEKVPELVKALDDGNEFVIGSRYVQGGGTDAEWGVFRWLNSKVATLMARPFTTAHDPMAGFFALRKQTFERGRGALNPIGYKIGLELMVKCNCRRVYEVPIHFTDRKHGQSKLSMKEQLRYLQHLRRLFIYRYWSWAHLSQFLVVGASGVIVNLAVLTLLLALGAGEKVSVAGGILVSLISNFLLNRRFTFSYARHESIGRQFAGFAGACALGAVVNYFTTVLISPYVTPIQLAALVGIVAGMGFNFVCSRFLVFRFKGENPENYRAGA